MINTAIALMQISAYEYLFLCNHINLAVRKIMEAIRTVHAKTETSQTTHGANDHGWYTSIMRGKRASCFKNILVLPSCFMNLIGKGTLNWSFDSVLFVGTHNFRTQNYLQLAYGVRTSSKASATAVDIMMIMCCGHDYNIVILQSS